MERKEIQNFDGLYGDTTTQYSSDYFFLELIATRSQNYDWVIQPHIHIGLYQVFIVQNGTVDFQDLSGIHKIESPCVFLIPPTQIHGLHYSPDVKGYILSISSSRLEDIFKTFSSSFKSFREIKIICHFEEDNTFEMVMDSLKNMENELFGDALERNVMLNSHVMQFFIRLYRLSQFEKETQNESHAMHHFRKFQNAIKHSEFTKSIPEFAHELNITSVHLNRICKLISGKSAIYLVHQNQINEAKKYLLHTSYSISEISYLLKFEYPNYFAKLFKKYTGFAPLDFRKQNRK